MELRTKINVALVTILALGCEGDKNAASKNSAAPTSPLPPAPAVTDAGGPISGGVVLIAGDSLAVGMAEKLKKITAECGYTPVVHAVVGTSSPQWISWLKKDVELHRPALILLSLGTNDATILESVIKQRSIELLVETLESSGSRYAWILPHNIDPQRIRDIDRTRNIIRASSRYSYDSPVLRLIPGKDGVHLRPEDYDRWAASVWTWSIKMGLARCQITDPQTIPQ